MTWLLRGLASILAIGAIAAAVIGYRLSNQPAVTPPPAPPVELVVQAVKPLRGGEPIGPEDIALRPVMTKPAGAMTALAQVVGQVPIIDVAIDQTLTHAHFPAEGNLQQGLRAGERAVAIKVDEVVGLGGFAQPGDQVDVLLFLRGSQETANASSAQVVLSAVRVLAFGESVQPAAAESDSTAGRAADKITRRNNRTPTSAVLAVPEDSASRLMLAANSGALRLALRPVGAKAATPADPHLVHLAELAQTSTSPSSRSAPPATRKPAAPARPRTVIPIHEGATVRQAELPTPNSLPKRLP